MRGECQPPFQTATYRCYQLNKPLQDDTDYTDGQFEFTADGQIEFTVAPSSSDQPFADSEGGDGGGSSIVEAVATPLEEADVLGHDVFGTVVTIAMPTPAAAAVTALAPGPDARATVVGLEVERASATGTAAELTAEPTAEPDLENVPTLVAVEADVGVAARMAASLRFTDAVIRRPMQLDAVADLVELADLEADLVDTRVPDESIT